MKSVRFLIAMLPVLAWSLGHAGASAAAKPPMHEAATPGTPGIRIPYGRYVGVVVDNGTRRFADMLLLEGGAIRIHIGGRDVGSGVIPSGRSRSAQFAGRLSVENGVVRGSGRLIGEHCTLPGPNRFCQAPATAKLEILAVEDGVYFDRLIASMAVTTGTGVEVWQVDMDRWDDLHWQITLPRLQGLLRESTAEFSGHGTTIIRVDAAGLMFFQSPATGCVGNGKMTPQKKFGVVGVELIIENCRGRFAYLNGRYLGFSTSSPSSVWNYDAVLRMWLVKPVGSARPAALTMWSIPAD